MWHYGGGFPRAVFLGVGIVQYPGPYKGAGAHGCCDLFPGYFNRSGANHAETLYNKVKNSFINDIKPPQKFKTWASLVVGKYIYCACRVMIGAVIRVTINHSRAI
jgi:hypothetical protein